jgi:hypothetical protein
VALFEEGASAEITGEEAGEEGPSE